MDRKLLCNLRLRRCALQQLLAWDVLLDVFPEQFVDEVVELFAINVHFGSSEREKTLSTSLSFPSAAMTRIKSESIASCSLRSFGNFSDASSLKAN